MLITDINQDHHSIILVKIHMIFYDQVTPEKKTKRPTTYSAVLNNPHNKIIIIIIIVFIRYNNNHVK